MTTTPQPIEGSNAFDQPGEWLKAALHTHSTVSDGTVAPEPLAMAYQEAGFDVLAITDHWRLTKFDAPDGLLTLPSAELGYDVANPLYPTQSTEFLVYGIDHIPDEPGGNKDNWYSNPIEHYEVRTFPDLTAGCAWAATMGAVVYVAHPYWNGLHVDDIARLGLLAGPDDEVGLAVRRVVRRGRRRRVAAPAERAHEHGQRGERTNRTTETSRYHRRTPRSGQRWSPWARAPSSGTS